MNMRPNLVIIAHLIVGAIALLSATVLTAIGKLDASVYAVIVAASIGLVGGTAALATGQQGANGHDHTINAVADLLGRQSPPPDAATPTVVESPPPAPTAGEPPDHAAPPQIV